MSALQVVQLLVSLSFLALGVYTVIDWLRHRERSRGYLALALATLGLTSILGQISPLTNGAARVALGDLSLILFMVSGYALLLFRDSFIPLAGHPLRRGGGLRRGLAAYFAVGYPTDPHLSPTPAQSSVVIALVLVWSACVLEPVVRFWLASRHRPVVQRARLRALGAGYSAIVLILLLSAFGGAAVTSVTAKWIFELVAVVSLPLLLVGFAPPVWLRRIWRQSEIDQLRDALHELVLFSPDRKTLAKRAIDWAIRLVGADGGAIIDADGSAMATNRMDLDAARQLAARANPTAPALLATPGSERDDAIVLPLRLDSGTGSLIVVSGPFTPFFGTDEVGQLRAYTVNVVAALDRARVTERLEALDRMKSQFLNLASHELRSPLGVITGYLSMLEQGALGQMKEPGVRAIAVLKAKALEMNLLVSQMLEAARLEEGKLSLKHEQLDLRRIAKDGLDVIRPMADARHELVLDAPPSEVPVLGDPDRLLSIVTNLVENAIKYSPDGGAVVCTVANVDGSASLTVRDAGVGIAAEDLPRLFNRFERLQNPRTSHVGGTGLGLYLARELARQHGGDIEVRSEPEKGSSFTLTLPVMHVIGESEPLPEDLPDLPVTAAPRLHVVSAEADESQLA